MVTDLERNSTLVHNLGVIMILTASILGSRDTQHLEVLRFSIGN